jgi:LysM repeat protein
MRLLAPLALVAAAFALITVVASGGGQSSTDESPAAATATPASTSSAPRQPREREQPRSYTVKPGDTPSAIADREGVPLDQLLEANPDVDPNALVPGAELTLP